MDLDYVQIFILAILALSTVGAISTLFVGLLPDPWRQRVRQFIREWTRLIIETFVVIAVSFLLAAFVRNLVVSGVLSVERASQALFVFFLAIIFYVLIGNLREEPPARNRGLAILSAGLSVAAITFLLSGKLGSLIQPLEIVLDLLRVGLTSAVHSVGWDLESAKASDAAVTNLAEAMGIALASLSAGTVVVTAAGALSHQLEEITLSLGFTHGQTTAAKKLRLPAESAIPSRLRLGRGYPARVRIDRMSDLQRLPHEGQGGTKKGRIRIIMYEGPQSRKGEDFTFKRIEEHAQSVDIDVDASLFFVYGVSRRGRAEIVCFGTGKELRELSTMREEVAQTDGDAISDSFYLALNHGDKEHLKSVVNEARKQLLLRQPAQDPLLATATYEAERELIDALGAIAESGVNRILLVSRIPPFERGILGASEIAKFLRAPKSSLATPSISTEPLEAHE